MDAVELERFYGMVALNIGEAKAAERMEKEEGNSHDGI